MSVTPEMRMWAFEQTATWTSMSGRPSSLAERLDWAVRLAEWAATGEYPPYPEPVEDAA